MRDDWLFSCDKALCKRYYRIKYFQRISQVCVISIHENLYSNGTITMSSIRDQLLKAGLVTEEQVKQAETKPKPRPNKSNKPAAGSSKHKKNQNPKPESKKPPVKKRELTDLERFYKERDATDKAEKLEQEKQRKEATRIRKEKRAKIGLLIKTNLVNDEVAEQRYNFVVGSSVKYLFVTEAQQTQLSNGELAIVFLGEKRCLIPVAIGKQILAIEPSRIVIISEPEESA